MTTTTIWLEQPMKGHALRQGVEVSYEEWSCHCQFFASLANFGYSFLIFVFFFKFLSPSSSKSLVTLVVSPLLFSLLTFLSTSSYPYLEDLLSSFVSYLGSPPIYLASKIALPLIRTYSPQFIFPYSTVYFCRYVLFSHIFSSLFSPYTKFSPHIFL